MGVKYPLEGLSKMRIRAVRQIPAREEFIPRMVDATYDLTGQHVVLTVQARIVDGELTTFVKRSVSVDVDFPEDELPALVRCLAGLITKQLGAAVTP